MEIERASPEEAWAKMEPKDIPTKPILHAAFSAALATVFSKSGVEGQSSVLDLGCGDGRIALSLAANHTGIGDIVGVDINSSAVAMATENSKAAANPTTFQFVVGDITTTRVAKTFTVVLAQLLISVVGELSHACYCSNEKETEAAYYLPSPYPLHLCRHVCSPSLEQ